MLSIEQRRQLLVPLLAFALAVPVLLATVRGYQILPTIVLAPFIAAAVTMTPSNRMTLAFVLCGAAGVVSVLAVTLLMPGHIGVALGLRAGLTGVIYETLFAASFLLLGTRVELRPAFFWLAVWSSVFTIVAAAPLLISGDPVRALSLTDSTASVNVTFFGLPVFGTYGINSLAPLFAVQAAICCGALFLGTRLVQPLFAAGLGCALFLAIGCESRTTTLTLLVLPVALLFYAMLDRANRRPAAIAGVAICAAIAVISVRGLNESRMLVAAEDVVSLVTKPHDEDAPQGEEKSPPESAGGAVQAKPAEPKPKPKPKPKTVDSISTGRLLIWRSALNEWLQSPIFGNGFVGFGRWANEPLPEDLVQNVTAHNFFVNPLWKGGLVFFTAYMAFTFIAAKRAWSRRSVAPEWFFGTATVLVLAGSAMTWDIANIPSAGAVVWFLLGSLGRPGGTPVDSREQSI